ncbi:hypothetical protein, partial [Niallia circulans]|uniref:hypothetical protein n=1 Tax=Niallia circulans TaxID=1397 RepID=UPI00300AA1CA
DTMEKFYSYMEDHLFLFSIVSKIAKACLLYTETEKCMAGTDICRLLGFWLCFLINVIQK